MSGPEEYTSAFLLAEADIPEALGMHLQELALRLSGTVYEDSFRARDDFIAATDPITAALANSEISTYLDSLKNGSLVGLTLHGLPRDPALPPAPLNGGRPDAKLTFVSEALAIGLAMKLGYPSIILGEKKEQLVHQITPVPGHETSQSNAGQVSLRLHQDLAPNPELPRRTYHEAMPTWLILTGVQRGSGTTPTYIAAIDEAIRRVSPTSLDILRQQRFVTNPPDSFLQAMPDAINNLPTHPILLDYEGQLEAAFDTSSDVRPMNGAEDTEAMGAIAELNAALDSVKQEVVIEPGTAVIFNNRRVVHGRGAVVAEENTGNKRWIQRVYVFEPDRLARIAYRNPLLSYQIGGGLVRISAGYRPIDPRLLELSGIGQS